MCLVRMAGILDDDWVKRVTVLLEDELHTEVKVWAVKHRVSMNDFFNEAIKKYLQDQREEMYGEEP